MLRYDESNFAQSNIERDFDKNSSEEKWQSTTSEFFKK